MKEVNFNELKLNYHYLFYETSTNHWYRYVSLFQLTDKDTVNYMHGIERWTFWQDDIDKKEEMDIDNDRVLSTIDQYLMDHIFYELIVSGNPLLSHDKKYQDNLLVRHLHVTLYRSADIAQQLDR